MALDTETSSPALSHQNSPRFRTKGIYLAVLNQGWIRTELVQRILQWSEQAKYRVSITFPAHKPISNNRNIIVQEFLERPEFDYLMMIDSDIVPPQNVMNLADFLASPDIDIIGGLCFAWQQHTIIPLVLEYDPKRNPEKPYHVMEFDGSEGLIECDAIGTGCILIKRKVLEHPKMKAPFTNFYDENGIKKEGLDLSFCRRAKELGFRVYCHLDYPCSHWTPFDLMEVYMGLTHKKVERIKNK